MSRQSSALCGSSYLRDRMIDKKKIPEKHDTQHFLKTTGFNKNQNNTKLNDDFTW